MEKVIISVTIFLILVNVDDDHEILYFENINRDGNLVEGLGDLVKSRDAVNKRYLEGHSLALDGSNVVTADLKMSGKKINGLTDPVGDGQATNKHYVNTENAKQDIAIADKASKSYVDNEIAKINNHKMSSFKMEVRL